MARGNGRMRIFEDEPTIVTSSPSSARSCEDFEIQCWNYCVMPNHYHTTLQLTLPNLSRAIQCLKRVTRSTGTSVTLACGPRIPRPLQEPGGSTRGLSLVSCVDTSPGTRAAPTWSTHLKTGNGAATQLPSACDRLRALSTSSATLGLFGPGDEAVLQAQFREFVCGEIDRTIEDRLRSSDSIVGDYQFRAGILPRPDAGSIAAHTSDEPSRTSRQ